MYRQVGPPRCTTLSHSIYAPGGLRAAPGSQPQRPAWQERVAAWGWWQLVGPAACTSPGGSFPQALLLQILVASPCPRQLSLGGVPALTPPLITPYRVLAAGRQDSGPRLRHGCSEDRTGLLPAAPPGLGSTTRKGATRSLCPWPMGTVLLGLHRMQVREPDLGSPRACRSAQWGSCPVQMTCHMSGQRVT